MIEIASGHAAIDRFLAGGYERVRGMSSRFAAAICGHLIRRQTEMGVAGSLAEIQGHMLRNAQAAGARELAAAF